ncbi:tetratricopeptide repeat protein [Nitrospirillum bahiense]|uniref:Tetratricopeptide repeat protein n=2 Tax=Nitrospirillum amazonense TaxID=28077 RepID=A0A560FJB2_9PROT|nr:tetratricopeptide repeat protein [Nitrospirillum amazonense]
MSPMEYIRRGKLELDEEDYKQALADFTQAATLDAQSDEAVVYRAFAHYRLEENQEARSDYTLASKSNPHNAMAWRGLALVEFDNLELDAAIKDFTRSLEIEADNHSALTHRAQAYWSINDFDHAMADIDAALRLQPDWIEGYGWRARLHEEMGGDKEDIAATAAGVMADFPDKADAYDIAGQLYEELSRYDDAVRAFTAELRLEPSARTYVMRAHDRPKSDRKGKESDLAAALSLDAGFYPAYRERAEEAVDAGDLETAVTAYSAALESQKDLPDALVRRGILLMKLGKTDLAARDFAAVRAQPTTWDQLNHLCWTKATGGVDLETALAECDASFTMPWLESSRSVTWNSRGFILLRLGRYQEAIASYDNALKINPISGMPLYGRGVARMRMGDRAGGEADLAQGVHFYYRAAEDFARYGITP